MRPRSVLLRWVVGACVAIAVVIQFIPINRTNPPVQREVVAPDNVLAILKRACYDCHSNETRWPWYSHVAPTSWLVAGHVNEARGDLNFSEWPLFDLELQGHAFKDIEEQIAKGKMPLASYTLIHRNAGLSSADRDTLLRWARSYNGGD